MTHLLASATPSLQPPVHLPVAAKQTPAAVLEQVPPAQLSAPALPWQPLGTGTPAQPLAPAASTTAGPALALLEAGQGKLLPPQRLCSGSEPLPCPWQALHLPDGRRGPVRKAIESQEHVMTASRGAQNTRNSSAKATSMQLDSTLLE